jgi:hypothetical protein
MTKNITLYTGYKVSGYISFSNATPVVGAAVLFRNSANTWFGSGWFSNATGYYFLNVPAGTYTIDAHPRTGNYYSGPTTDFPPYTEYNFTVNGNTGKNITVGGLPAKSSTISKSASSYVLSPEPSPKPSPEPSPKPSSSPPAEVTPTQITTSTKASTMTLLGIVFGIIIAATPIVTVISGLLLYFKKRKKL